MFRGVPSFRYFCTRFQPANNVPSTLSEEAKLFIDSLPKVIDAVATSGVARNVPRFINRYQELIQYTVLKEHRFRPPIFIDSYKALELPHRFSKEKWELVIMFAWCIELTQSAMIVQDDIWDQKLMRWNNICWHQKPNVGLISINDGVLLYESAFSILKKYFSNLPEYLQLTEVLHYMNLTTAIGQSLDWDCKRDKKPVFEYFSMETFNAVGCRKGGTAIVDGPFMAALVLTENLPMLEYVWSTLYQIGLVFQIDNDILDFYEENGKVREPIGDDIRNGQLTWMAAQVIESGDYDVINVFKQNYGRSEPECQKEIVNIYNKFKFFDKYLEYRLRAKNMIKSKVSKMPQRLQNAIFCTIKAVIPALSYK